MLTKIRIIHHPMLINEFGDTAYVIKEDNQIIAYLFGFIATKEPVAYIHFIAVHKNHYRKGLASQLYNHFVAIAKEKGCARMKALTNPQNIKSINFHQKHGMTLQGKITDDDVPVMKNYAGPGEDRVVMIKELT